MSESGQGLRKQVVRRRARCPKCSVSFGIYKDNHYPHRQYQIDVVASVTAAVVVVGQSAQASARVGASATSARRWKRWVGELTAPGELIATAQELDPDAGSGSGISGAGPGQAARVLFALEVLGAALVRRDVSLRSRSGLGRVLEWQHRYHGVTVWLKSSLRRLSPAMALGSPGGSG